MGSYEDALKFIPLVSGVTLIVVWLVRIEQTASNNSKKIEKLEKESHENSKTLSYLSGITKMLKEKE